MKDICKIDKIIRKIEHICNKYFLKYSLKKRKNLIDMYICFTNNEDQWYYFIDNDQYKKINRTIIKNTLNDINYIKQKEDKWSTSAVVVFLDDVFELANYDKNSEEYKELADSISKRFNVPINRLNSQANLFLLNLNKGQDNFKINTYFSDLEILLYKYRDADKLQQCINENKLTEKELRIIKEYYGV